ncbi:hypothetical protein [Acinetobacter sp. 102]|uniref:hypothetical protein n=1 Tax=Acinetobacter sp. 102 TaxID=3098766 RepID=UPI003008CBDE
MNIYLVEDIVPFNSYDTYDSFVIACETEEEAKKHADTMTGMSSKDSTATLIGTALEGMSGVLLASFNAG